MEIDIYGMVGHSSGVRMQLEDLDLDELDVGREFIHRGRIYEIRSVFERDGILLINVAPTMEVPTA